MSYHTRNLKLLGRADTRQLQADVAGPGNYAHSQCKLWPPQVHKVRKAVTVLAFLLQPGTYLNSVLHLEICRREVTAALNC
jgi:hypothetical protein